LKLEIIKEEAESEQARLFLNGVVNIHTTTQLREHLKPLLDDHHDEVRVDLAGVRFIDSAGIAALVEGLQWSRATGKRFVLSGMSDNVRDIFSLAKLDTVFDIENGAPAA